MDENQQLIHLIDELEEQRLWWEMVSWLNHEAELLDEGRFDEWLNLLGDDLVYEAPVRLTKELGEGGENAYKAFVDQYYFLEDRTTLELRVKRLKTDFAWAEDPPSRTRRFVSNVRVNGRVQDEAEVRSYLLLYRNRGDDTGNDLISAERQDVLYRGPVGWKLSSRLILIDQATLGTKNLGVFL
jgi:3-phenylpropionate/cinnamic acid dioxygenase small subunit